jgi:hypothetical protein
MNHDTKDSVINYLEKSYEIIQRLTETNKILLAKNRELLATNIFYQSKIKLLQRQNKELKRAIKVKPQEIEQTTNQSETEFEIL